MLAAAFPNVGTGLLGVALALGLTLLTMAFAIGPISGCHINPAVSIGLWAGGRLLGAQAPGLDGVEKRIDALAMAIQMGATVYDMEEAELCYAPPFGSAKDPVNFAGMVPADVLRQNGGMLAVFKRSCFPMKQESAEGVVHVTLCFRGEWPDE